jgi:hypothetical protein
MQRARIFEKPACWGLLPHPRRAARADPPPAGEGEGNVRCARHHKPLNGPAEIITMRAEIGNIVAEIKQSVGLLRRHL